MKKIILLIFIVNNVIAFAQNNLGANELLEKQKFQSLYKLAINLDEYEELYYKGRADIGLHKYAEAVDLLTKLTDVHPTSDGYYWLAIATGGHLESQNAFKQISLAKEMVKYLKRAVELDRTNAEAKYLLAKYYTTAPGIMGGDFELAEQYQKELEQEHPLYGLMVKSYLLAERKQWKASENLLLDILKKNADFKEAYDRLAYVCEKGESKNYVIGIKSIRTANPNEAYPIYLLAMLSMQEQNYDQAESYFSDLLSSHPNFSAGWYQRGKLAYLRKRDLEKGINAFQKFLSLPEEADNPSFAAAHWRLGLIYQTLRNDEMAKWHLKESLRLDPTYEESKKALQNFN